MTDHTADPAAARRHLETTADLVVVHDIMAEALSTLRGIYVRAALRSTEHNPDEQWWLSLAGAVDTFRRQIDVTDRTAMLAALDRARSEIARARDALAA